MGVVAGPASRARSGDGAPPGVLHGAWRGGRFRRPPVAGFEIPPRCCLFFFFFCSVSKLCFQFSSITFDLQLFLPKISPTFSFFGIDLFFLLKFCFRILFLSKKNSITFVINFCSFQCFLQFFSFHIVTKKCMNFSIPIFL